MPSKPVADPATQPPAPSTDGAPMTADQAVLLRRLAFDAYEPEAFRRHLTQGEAGRRIAALTAKLKLQDEPPHTL
jgi:hypothetical protein